MPKIQDKIGHKLIWSLKIFMTLIGFALVIWFVQSSKTEFDLLSNHWQAQPILTVWAVLILILGSVLNWYGEIKKWQKLVGYISFLEAIKQSLVGHSLSLFTTNKWGEYGGKCLFCAKAQSSKIIALTGLGHLSQLMITLIFGLLGLIMIYNKFDLFEVLELKWSWLILLSLILIGIAISFKVVRQKLLSIWLQFKSIKQEKTTSALFWSGFRYIVFAHQFLLLLWCFDADVGYVLGLSLISSVYILSSIVPVLAIGDVMVKGSLAVMLMSFFEFPVSAVLITVFLMWIGNVILPAVFGLLWLWSLQPAYLKSKV
ncbi:hypothetical protein [Mesohalobacter halotolerans]|uniref:Lysylphosphatidylglycerol synthase TM region n=1 Tax=Mesohalobacter halotolerans TaxID=1883405 RepID=A0A4U5TRM2_9FLAO|nr:hypothetical protein [Mesohalobacter halotolerans]TKS56909.1 hypothetical protein FCN74_00335 [Mesohalobacter halotolerans]